MKTSRSKRAGLSVLQEDEDRSFDQHARQSTFSSFFSRSRRNQSPTTAVDALQTKEIPKSANRRSSLSSRQYKSMSRSMSDLGSILLRTDTVESANHDLNLLESKTQVVHALRPSSGPSPTKRSPVKRKESLPFPADTIAKQGWLNKVGNKKEHNLKLQRVYLRDAKLYAYKAPADLLIRAFDLDLTTPDQELRDSSSIISPMQSLHPADFDEETRKLLFDIDAAAPTKRYSYVHSVRELRTEETDIIPMLAFVRCDSLIICQRNTGSVVKPSHPAAPSSDIHLQRTLWRLQAEVDFGNCELTMQLYNSGFSTSDNEDQMVVKLGHDIRSFVSRQAEPITVLYENCVAQKTLLKQQIRPATAPNQLLSDAIESGAKTDMSDELFVVRQILRDQTGKLTHGTLSGLCRQILLQKMPLRDSRSIGSILLQTLGLWADCKDVMTELHKQLNVLAETATRGRAEQVVRFLLESAASLLLDSSNVETLLRLVDLVDEDTQKLLRDDLWTRRTNLMAVITMDFSRTSSPLSHRSDSSWMAEYQSLSRSGLQAESILAIPANLFAEQLHIFHRYYLSHWNPAGDKALFFNTYSKGASRNPLVFGPRRMHFLTSTILHHVLSLDTRPISTAQRAAICTQWILIGMMLKRMGDMAGWLAVVMALCAPSIVRLKQMWSNIEARLLTVVEKEWSPVMRDLFRRSVGGSKLSTSSAHVLAPDTEGGSSFAQDVVPFYGDLCDAIEVMRPKIFSSDRADECVNVLVLEGVRELLASALESYQLYIDEAESAHPLGQIDDHNTIVPAIQDCFKQLNSVPMEIIDVCSPILLTSSLKCEVARVDDLAHRKSSIEHGFRTGAFVPLLFNDLLPSYRLFDASVLLDITDAGRRVKGNTSLNNSKTANPTSTSLRRLNSFPPTQRPAGNTTGHDYLDETTRAKAAASVGQWKMLRHVRDLAGVSDEIVTFVSGDLVLKAADASLDASGKRRPQSVLVDSKKRDSVVSRRQSLLIPETPALEPDSDLVIRPQKLALRGPDFRELAVKAASLEVMLDLLMFDIQDLQSLQVASSPFEHISRSSISLDRPEFMRIFLVSYRAHCSPSQLLELLISRFAKAESVSTSGKDHFPSWSVAQSNVAFSKEVDLSLLEKTFTGIFEVISLWLNLAPADFTGSVELLRLLELFLSDAEGHVTGLETYSIVDSSASVCRDLCASNLRRIRKQLLRVCHRPQSWKLSDIRQNNLAVDFEPYALSQIITLDDACVSLKQLDQVVENVLACIGLEDWMCCFELFEDQSIDPKAFFPKFNDAAMLDQDSEIPDVLSLIGSIGRRGAETLMIEHMPLPVRKLMSVRQAITAWTMQQVTEEAIPLDTRVSRVQTFLELIKISCIQMSSLDITATSNGTTVTQIVPSFVANAIAAGLVSAQSRVFSYTWHLVAQGRGQQDSSCDLAALLPSIDIPEPHTPMVPCLAWLFDRMLEVACYIPDTTTETAKLINFDKRRYIFNLLSNLDIVGPSVGPVNVLNEVDNPFLFVLADPEAPLDWKVVRSAAYKENQLARNIKLARPFATLVSREHEKFRRDVRCRDHLDRQLKDAQKAASRKRADEDKLLEPGRRSSTRSKYGMNSLLRAVRPISVAIGGNWTPEKGPGLSRVISTRELPAQCTILKGTRPSLTIDLVHSVSQVTDSKQCRFCVRSEDGMENHFQAPSSVETDEWIEALNAAALSGAKNRRTIIREDARLAGIEELPQFSPRNSIVVDIVSASFAVDLSTLIRREGSSIPRIATALMDEVERRGLQEVGIYRISGSFSTVNALKAAFNSGSPVDLTKPQWADINAVAGVFKLWLRELPEPLMTYPLYNKFLATLDIEDYNVKSLSLKELIHQLPVPNFSLLKRLIEHLEKITDYEATNHMYAHNLAIIFGPNILQPVPSEMSFASSMKDLGRVQTIIRNIIFQCHWIFSTEDEQEPATVPVLASIRESTTESEDNNPA